MAMAVLSSSQHHQPLRHCPSPQSRFRRIDQRPRGLTYPKLSRPPFLILDERLRVFIERCHLSLRLNSSSRGLKHGQAGETDTRLATRSHAKDSDHCDADTESAEWISNALRDPMVEVDPVTVGHQILAEKQSRPLELSSTLVDSSPPVSQRLVRLRHIAVASAIAVFLLAVVAILQYLRFRKAGERRQGNKGVDLSTSTSELSNTEMEESIEAPHITFEGMKESIGAPHDTFEGMKESIGASHDTSEGMKETIGASHDTVEGMKESIGASHDIFEGMPPDVAGNAAVEGDPIVPNVGYLQSELQANLEDAVLKQTPAYEWPEPSDFPKDIPIKDETELNTTPTDAIESFDSEPSEYLYTQDSTGEMVLKKGWNGFSIRIPDKTESEVHQSLSETDLADASLAQELSEVSDIKGFTEHTLETDINEEPAFVEEQLPGQGSSYEGDGTKEQGLELGQSDSADSVDSVYTSQGPIQNGGVHTTDPLHIEGKPPLELHPNTSYWSSSNATSSHPGTHGTLGSSSYDLQIPSKSSFDTRPDDLRVLEAPESELPPFESTEISKDKALELERETSTKALEQALPALFVTVGTVGSLWGVTGGLKVVGFAAAAQLITQDLFWAESREAFWRELRSITDRQKLRDFLLKRNAVKDD